MNNNVRSPTTKTRTVRPNRCVRQCVGRVKGIGCRKGKNEARSAARLPFSHVHPRADVALVYNTMWCHVECCCGVLSIWRRGRHREVPLHLTRNRCGDLLAPHLHNVEPYVVSPLCCQCLVLVLWVVCYLQFVLLVRVLLRLEYLPPPQFAWPFVAVVRIICTLLQGKLLLQMPQIPTVTSIGYIGKSRSYLCIALIGRQLRRSKNGRRFRISQVGHFDWL